jgi:hypothetical protein
MGSPPYFVFGHVVDHFHVGDVGNLDAVQKRQEAEGVFENLFVYVVQLVELLPGSIYGVFVGFPKPLFLKLYEIVNLGMHRVEYGEQAGGFLPKGAIKKLYGCKLRIKIIALSVKKQRLNFFNSVHQRNTSHALFYFVLFKICKNFSLIVFVLLLLTTGL